MRAPNQTHIIDTDSKLVQLLRELGNERPLRRLLYLYFQTYDHIEVQQFDRWPDREITEEERARRRPSRTATRLLVYGFKGSRRRSLASIMLRPRDEPYPPRLGDVYASVQEALDPERIFLKCSTRSQVQWLGRPRKKSRPSKIICFPFIQKHHEESWMCAHAAVRMIGEWLRQTDHPICKGLERRHWTFPAIDRALGKDFPHPGLTAAEMKNAIEGMGFHVLDYNYEENPRPNYPADSIVYSYMESGIPVLVLFGLRPKRQEDAMAGHVVAVIGHTFERHAWWPEAERRYYAKLFENQPGFLKSTAWMDFLIHDDNYGPYLVMPKDFLRAGSVPPTQDAANQNTLPHAASGQLWRILVPFREGLLRSQLAEAIAFQALHDPKIKLLYDDYLDKQKVKSFWPEEFQRRRDDGRIVMRTWLVSRMELLKICEKRGPQLLHWWCKGKSTNLPKIQDLVWITEFTSPDLFASGGGILGHVVVDAKAQVQSADDFPQALQYVHLAGGFHLWSSPDGSKWMSKQPQEELSPCLTWRTREVSPTR